MITFNQSLHQTSHQSILVRKARRLGFLDIESLVQLAVQRGCTHYQNVFQEVSVRDPGQSVLSNEELVVLLLHGNYRFEPMAIRCAAQLLKSSLIDPERVGFLAVKERCVIPLKHIARNGAKHDPEASGFWGKILVCLGDSEDAAPEGVLPHVSRFMINPGIQRGKIQPAKWLNPAEQNNE